MGWVHEDPDADLYNHEGYAVAVLADGTEPEPIQVPLTNGDAAPNSAWWLYHGRDGRPLAAGVKAACACGWRAKEIHPVYFDDHEMTDGFEYNDGPYWNWAREHIAPLLGTAMPPELSDALDTVAMLVGQLADERPLAVLTAIGRMEKLVAHCAPTAGAAARTKGETWSAVGKALGTSRQAAYQRFSRFLAPELVSGPND